MRTLLVHWCSGSLLCLLGSACSGSVAGGVPADTGTLPSDQPDASDALARGGDPGVSPDASSEASPTADGGAISDALDEATAVAACFSGSALAGAPYDITKSRFAFGSPPVPVDAGSLVRYTGSDGVVAIFSDGSELASLNAGAPEADLPDWSSDTSALTAHVTDYWVSMGVATCQIAATGISSMFGVGGSVDGGMTYTTAVQNNVDLQRAVDGVSVIDSVAVARFDVNDQTTSETFYWPEIPADVVSAAVAFKNQLADPAALSAYKAKLPANAQGPGSVVIRHTNAGSPSSFQALATYQVETRDLGGGGDGDLFMPEDENFDENGNLVTFPWW
jgi:hypothetical protein